MQNEIAWLPLPNTSEPTTSCRAVTHFDSFSRSSHAPEDAGEERKRLDHALQQARNKGAELEEQLSQVTLTAEAMPRLTTV